MAQRIKVLAAKPSNLEPTWCPERADSSYKLSSDPQHAHGHPYAHAHKNNSKINAALCLAASEGMEDQKAGCGGLGEPENQYFVHIYG